MSRGALCLQVNLFNSAAISCNENNVLLTSLHYSRRGDSFYFFIIDLVVKARSLMEGGVADVKAYCSTLK